MDKTQQIIIILLVLAILFSSISIFVVYSALNVDLPKKPAITGNDISRGNAGVNLFVETAQSGVG